MLATTVVNVKIENYDVYIGRDNPMIPKSRWGEWGNPFPLRKDASMQERLDVVAKYRAWLFEKLKTDPELWEKIHTQLGGKRLGCYCAPDPCHGDILAEVADQGIPPTQLYTARRSQ